MKYALHLSVAAILLGGSACAADTSATSAATAATPADEVELLTNQPLPLDPGLIQKPGQMNMAEAKALIEKTLGAAYTSDPKFYCIIHQLIWNPSSTAQDHADLKTDKWFVYRGGDKTKWSQSDLEGTRIYGSRKIGVLYVHWVQGVEEPTLQFLKDYPSAHPEYKGTKDPDVLLQDFRTKPQLHFQDSQGRALFRAGNNPGDKVYVAIYPPIVSVRYEIDVNQKIPGPLKNVFALLGVPNASASFVQLELKQVPVWAGSVFNIQYSPSDIKVMAEVGDKNDQVSQKTFDNEGNYYVDFGAAIPLRSTKQLQYNSTSGGISASTVDKYTAYGVVDLFFKPIDVRTNYTIWPPGIVAGIGLTGKPFDRLMAGMSVGTGKVNGFIGCAFNRVTSSLTPTTTTSQWDKKIVFGLNITAKQLTDLLKSSKK